MLYEGKGIRRGISGIMIPLVVISFTDSDSSWASGDKLPPLKPVMTGVEGGRNSSMDGSPAGSSESGSGESAGEEAGLRGSPAVLSYLRLLVECGLITPDEYDSNTPGLQPRDIHGINEIMEADNALREYGILPPLTDRGREGQAEYGYDPEMAPLTEQQITEIRAFAHQVKKRIQKLDHNQTIPLNPEQRASLNRGQIPVYNGEQRNRLGRLEPQGGNRELQIWAHERRGDHVVGDHDYYDFDPDPDPISMQVAGPSSSGLGQTQSPSMARETTPGRTGGTGNGGQSRLRSQGQMRCDSVSPPNCENRGQAHSNDGPSTSRLSQSRSPSTGVRNGTEVTGVRIRGFGSDGRPSNRMYPTSPAPPGSGSSSPSGAESESNKGHKFTDEL